MLYREYVGAVIDRAVAAELARAYGSADMAILAQHGTLVTGASAPQVLVRALSFEWRCRKAWEVACMGRSGIPLPDTTAESLAQYADEYGEILFEAYGREQVARDPDLFGLIIIRADGPPGVAAPARSGSGAGSRGEARSADRRARPCSTRRAG